VGDLYANAVAVADGYRPTITHYGRVIWEGDIVDDHSEAAAAAQQQVTRGLAKLFASIK
jgi:hypothetical protein